MNSIKNFGLKFTMIFVALLCASYSFAQDQIKAKLVVNDGKPIGMNNYKPFDVTIALENEDPVAALQFRFALPEELEFAYGENTEPTLDYDRLIKNNHVVAMNLNNGMVVLQALNLKDIKGNSGNIMSIPVKVKEGMLDSGKTVDITISKIEFTNGDGTQIGKQNNFTVPVMLEPFTYTAYLTPNPLAIYPDGSQEVAFCLKNVYTATEEEAPVVGLTVKMELPKGLSVDDETITVNEDRVFNRTAVSYSNGMFMLADISQNKPLKTGYSDGPLFTFTLKATEDYTAEDAEIVLSDLEVSAVVGAYAVNGVCENCALVNTASLIANKAAYDKVIETVDKVQADYEAALAEAKEANPDYDFTEWEELITGAINQTKEGAAQALAAATEDGGEFVFPFDGADIEAMIEEMKNAPAKSALENANQIAYDKVIEAVDAVEAEYEAALAEVKEANPDYDFAEYEEIITKAIEEAKTGAEQALAAANEDGVEFFFPFDAEEIQNVIADMKAAPAKSALEAANQAAYDGVVEAINAVEAEYEAALAEVKEANPDYDFAEYEEIITKAIEEAKTGAEQALASANEDGVEYFFPFDAEEIQNVIADMKAAPAKSALEAANQAAYDEVAATLAGLETEYESALAEAKEANPDFDFSDYEEIIPVAIEEAKTGAEQALAAANEEGEEFSFPFDGSDIQAMIDEMKAAPVKAANQAAYDQVVEAINAVEAEYEAALAEVKEANPDYDFAEYEAIISAAIEDAQTGAAQALAAANEDAVEFFFPFDAEEIQNVIADMKAAPAKSALEAANQAAYDEVAATLAELETEYESALAEAKEAHPDFDYSEYEVMIPQAIEDAKTGAAQALEAANEDGEEFNFPFDGADIKAMIDQMVADAETSAVDAIAAEVANGKAMIFTLDGKQHVRPVSGEVNVIVRQNSTSKIFIK